MTRYRFDEDDYPIIPEGKRTLAVLSKKDVFTKTGKNMVVFELEDKETGLRMKHRCMNEAKIEDGGRWKLKDTLSAILGYRLGKGDIDVDDSSLIGKSFTAEVTKEEYQGRNYAVIKKIIMPEQVSPGQTTITMEDLEGDLPF